jgi:hypothetical protein
MGVRIPWWVILVAAIIWLAIKAPADLSLLIHAVAGFFSWVASVLSEVANSAL